MVKDTTPTASDDGLPQRPRSHKAENAVMGAGEWGLILILSVIWGGSFFFIGVAVKEMTPLTIVLCRVGLASVILLGVVRLTGKKIPTSPGVWGMFFVIGALNNLIPFSLIVWGQTHIDSSLAAILNATTPHIQRGSRPPADTRGAAHRRPAGRGDRRLGRRGGADRHRIPRRVRRPGAGPAGGCGGLAELCLRRHLRPPVQGHGPGGCEYGNVVWIDGHDAPPGADGRSAVAPGAPAPPPGRRWSGYPRSALHWPTSSIFASSPWPGPPTSCWSPSSSR